MKKLLLILLSQILLTGAVLYVVCRIMPDGVVAQYVQLAKEKSLEKGRAWWTILKDQTVAAWHKFRDPEPKLIEKEAVPETEAEAPVEKPVAAEPPAPAKPAVPEIDLSKPWKGLEPGNWYGGKKITEKSLEGKIVMVYAFSEADEDSVALLPRIEQLWSAYKTKPFVIIGSHRGGKSAKISALVKKAKLTFPVYEGAGRTKEPSAGGHYPVVYVVDDAGKMIYRGRSELEATEAFVDALPNVGKKR